MKPTQRTRNPKRNQHFYYPPVRKRIARRNQCIKCFNKVKKNEKAMQCESCRDYQHMSCNPGISSEIYEQAKSGLISVAWHCANCPSNSIHS